jgi:hypothetical protein
MAIKEVKYTAVITEHEKGWGAKIDEVREFDTERERDDFVREYNSRNNLPYVPDWYMKAEPGKDIIRDLPGR